VKCWGIGRPGQLGYGPTNDLLAPAAEAINLGAGKTAVQLAIGTHFSCALLNDESVKCWGSSEGGVLGLGHFSALTAPGLGTIEFGADKSVMMLAAGSQHTCAYLSDETVKCWGHGTEGQLGYGDNKTLQVPGTGSINLGSGALPFKMVASNHTCVRFSDSKVNCWGPGYEGQLGYGNTNSLAAPSLSPINFSTAAGAIDIAVGGAHTCAILQDYSVRCWGEGGSGQLGYGSATRSLLGPTTSPVALGAGKTAKRIVAGAYHTCALLNDNSVKCWGSGQKGQLGTGVFGDLWTPPAAPVDFGIERTAVSLVAGHEFTCALLDDATVRCWGDGSNGQLGVGYFSGNAYRVSPQTAINFGQGLTARSITAGWHHACAILNDSSLKCWGDNSRGQLGYGNRDDYFTPNYIPVNLGSGVAAVQAVAGGMHSCAVLDNQTAKCWGEAAEGQLGIKDITVWAPLERSISYEPMIF
jgi:alpha-tubulin suppressor-like RCC1 family protein